MDGVKLARGGAEVTEDGGSAASSGGVTEPGEDREFSSGYRLKLVILLSIAGLFNFTDRNLFPVLAQAIKEDLRLSDLQLGLLGGPAFAFLYAISGLPIARLADSRNRVRIIAGATTIWSAFCIACGLAHGFVHMLFARAGLGVGEAGFFPAATSLVGDHYPPQKRASILAIIQLGSPASTLFCALIAATIGTIWGWRAAMIAVGVPGAIVGVMIWLTLREPGRGRFDTAPAASAQDRNWRQALASLIARPTLLRVTLAASLVTFCVNAIAVFYVAYFVRIHGWTLAQGGYAFGVIQCVAATIGLLGGGFGADWLAARVDKRWWCWLPMIGLVIATGCYIMGFRQDNALVAAGFILVAGICLFTFYTPSIGMVQSMAEPRTRATAVAIFLLAGTVVGVGLGPLFAGLASDLYAARQFSLGDYAALCPGGQALPGAGADMAAACAQASAQGLKAALTISPLPLLLAAAGYAYASRSLPDDL